MLTTINYNKFLREIKSTGAKFLHFFLISAFWQRPVDDFLKIHEFLKKYTSSKADYIFANSLLSNC